MGLKSIFQRQPGEGARKAAAEAGPDSVQEARTRARRRLIGAAVLVVIGVIGFPILFETQPRPIPVDIPIEIPKKDGAPPLVMPAPRPSPKPAVAPQVASAPAEVITETVAEAGREVPAPAASAPAAAKPASAPPKAAETRTADTRKPEPKPAESRPEPKPVKPPEAATTAAADAKRAQALLEGKSLEKDAEKKDGRFVVQVGAFADTAAARETRQKVEKLGLKTYTQVAETSQGSRVRVRVGPFSTRDEAERAQARIKAAGSNAVVLTL